MRANTSLFGHLLGASPEIEGYYEMHIGYYSWKSRWRQKLLHFADHPVKPQGRYMFDKILHSEHTVDDLFLADSHARLFFSLRNPQQTIPSIVKLWRDIDPCHDYCQPELAARYYCERLLELQKLAERAHAGYMYFDAQCLRDDNDRCLEAMSEWLQLKHKLSNDYKVQPRTGAARAGDHSSNLLQGKIVPGSSDYSAIQIADDLLSQANTVYSAVRSQLVRGAAMAVTTD